MNRMKKKIIYITERQDKFLKKIKELSGKSESSLFREGVELLIRNPGIKEEI